MRNNNLIRYAAALALGAPMSISATETVGTAAQPVSSRASETRSHFSREQWGLDETEWRRYQTLMRGVRGSVSPDTLSPIEVLGIHSRDDEERMKYARLWARIMRDDAERILAFQRAYQAAWKELNPSGQIIDVSQLPSKDAEKPLLQAGDRVLLFLRFDDCPECDALYTRVRRAAHDADAQLDIYFTGTRPGQDDKKIRAWVTKNPFDPDRIKRRRITFNHDNGALARTGGIAATAPAAYRIRDDRIDPLQIGMTGL